MLYDIFEESLNVHYKISLSAIFNLIKLNPDHVYFKYINEHMIKINNNFVLHTQFICHRINTIEQLNNIDPIFGVEIDIRDNIVTNELMLAHDPFVSNSDSFEKYLQLYDKNTLILNIKSERTEIKCLELLKKYNKTNYFFLDSTIPMIYIVNNKYNVNNFACRYSEFEPIELVCLLKDMINWVWVDCFTNLPLTNDSYKIIKSLNKQICIVSPELQNQHYKINEYRNLLINNNFIPDAICCKLDNIIYWI